MGYIDIIEMIKDEASKGNIVIFSPDGLSIHNLDEFVNQPSSGVLYDLNRSEEVIAMFAKDDPKWINDYACALVIRRLKDKIAEFESD